MRLLECGTSLLKTCEPKRHVIYAHRLDILTQCWTGKAKPQMTFPFKSENGRCMMPVTRLAVVNQLGTHCQFFELFCFLGMIFHGSWLWARFLLSSFKPSFFSIIHRWFTSECFYYFLCAHCSLGRVIQFPPVSLQIKLI